MATAGLLVPDLVKENAMLRAAYHVVNMANILIPSAFSIGKHFFLALS